MERNVTEKKRLVVVVPVFNEAENIGILAECVMASVKPLKSWDAEMLFVDDGSKDDSLEKINELRGKGIAVGCVVLSRNFGHQSALAAGLQVAEGDVVISMDADLQHPPEYIPRMIEEFEKGADVVQMVRTERASGKKGIFSNLFYKVFDMVAHTDIVPGAADFRLLSRRVINVLKQVPERDKFFRGLIPMLGFRQVQLNYKEGKRTRGMPSYSFDKSWKMGMKALFDFSTVPLTFVFWLGTGMALISFIIGIGHIVNKLLRWEHVSPGFTDIITAVFFLNGCILVAVGILGRYLIRILEQLRRRPTFIIADVIPGAPAHAAKSDK